MSHRPPFVLLHGWACPTSTWRPVAERLRAAGCRVDVPALLGYGSAGTETDEAGWTLEAAAHDVARLLAGLGAPAVVVGHSLGGSVAATLAVLHPELVAGVGFVGMVPVAPGATTSARLTELFLQPDSRPTPEAIGMCLAAWYREPPTDPDVLAELESAFHVPGPVLMGSLRAALTGVAPEVPGQIEAPVAVVLGSGDRTRPREEVEQLLRAHPGWSRTIVPGAGHMVQWEAPGECAAALLAGPWSPTRQ